MTFIKQHTWLPFYLTLPGNTSCKKTKRTVCPQCFENYFQRGGGCLYRWYCKTIHTRTVPRRSKKPPPLNSVFLKISEDVRSLPKTSEVCQRQARSQCFSLQKSEIARKVLPFIHFTHGFLSLHGSELTYFWKLCQAGRQQLTFFNQAWEIGPQAWAGVRSKFSTRRRESWQV